MDFTQATTDVVGAVLACLPSAGWQAALLDYEIREMSDGFDSDYVGIVLVADSRGDLTQSQFQLDQGARQAVMALYLQRKEDAAEENAGFVLQIERPGNYRIEFKHKVKRLDGIWDQAEEQFIDNYLDHYLREKASR